MNFLSMLTSFFASKTASMLALKPLRRIVFIAAGIAAGIIVSVANFANFANFASASAQTAPPAQLAQYVLLSPEQVKSALRSSQRTIYSLAGEWQRAMTANEMEWKTVTLPFSETGSGEIHYRRSFTISQELIDRYEWQVQLLASNYKTQVIVNGQYLQSHAGGTMPFQVRIPDQYLKSGENVIELIVDNRLDAVSTIPLRRIPHQPKVYGGVFRELYLVGTSEVFFGSVETKTTFGNSLKDGTVQVTASISSGALRNLLIQLGDSLNAIRTNATQLRTSIDITAEIRSDSGVVARGTPVTIEIAPNRNIQVKLSVPFSALRLWSPNSPNMYTFVAQIRRGERVLDDFVSQIGLYNVQHTVIEDKAALTLNGEPIVFKCVDYNEDSETNRHTLTVAEYERDIIAIKTLGANMIRLRHTTPHPMFSYLCDKYGLFVLVDVPLTGAPTSVLAKENFIVTAQLAVREMIFAYEHHPSTFAWGIGEDLTEGTPELAAYTKRMLEVIRPNSAKMVYKSTREGAKSLEVEGFDIVIFDMFTEPVAAFRAETERLLGLCKQSAVGVFSFGKIINPTNHNGYSDPLSVEAQAKLIRNCFRTLQENGISRNVTISSFNDYLAERPVLNVNNNDQFVITSGFVSRSRDARVAYQMVKALFNDEKEPVLETGNHLPESPVFYTIVSIVLLILFFILVNSNRRFREDVMRALMRPYNFYTDIRDQRILSNAGTFTLALILSGTIGLLVSSVLYFLRFNYHVDYILTHLIPSDTLKEFVNTIVWLPWASFLVAALLFMVLLGVVTLLVRAGSWFVRARILMSDAFVITVWACIPLVFMLAMTMGLYKVFTTTTYTQIALLLILGVLVWCLYRALRGTAVIYDVPAPRIYVLGVLLVLIVLASIAIIYNVQFATFAYAQYFFATLW
jgi:beta-galactosidase